MGFPVHVLRFTGPPYTITGLAGTRKLGVVNLNLLGLTQWFNRGYGGHPMPHQLEGFKLSELARIRKKTLMYGLFSAAVIGVIVAFYVILDIHYRIGADKIDYGAIYLGGEAYRGLHNWLQYPTEPNYTEISLAGIGFGVTVFLMTMRSLFLWWPFHPLGFAMAGTWGMASLWSCLLISSVIKWSILKYGGLRSYRRAVPLFLGLILGDFVMGSFWNLVGLAFGIETYSFWL